MIKQVLATISGPYYVYRDGDKVTVSFEDVENENKFGVEWETSLKDARDIFAAGVAVTHTSRWQAVRAVLAAWKKRVTL